MGEKEIDMHEQFYSDLIVGIQTEKKQQLVIQQIMYTEVCILCRWL